MSRHMAEPTENEQTCDRLLQSAVEVFAERGFKDATVRDICARAGVNVASVNYYFRSKEALYREALAFAFREADRKYPQDAAANPELPPEERLRQFILAMVHRLMDDSHLGFHGRLIAREIADPTVALDHIVETVMRPRFLALRDILPRLAGPGWDPADIDRLVHNIIGQCLVYRHSRPLIERLCPEIIAGPEAVERTAELIVRFSLAALRQLAAERGTTP
jgi:AcrR family transcriptional regulator